MFSNAADLTATADGRAVPETAVADVGQVGRATPGAASQRGGNPRGGHRLLSFPKTASS